MSLIKSFRYSKQNSSNVPNDTEIIEVEESVRSIPKGAFAGFTRLQTVTFAPGSLLQTIQARAFLSCQALTHIEFPSHLQEIKEYAFLDCRNLQSIQFAPDSCLTTIRNNAFCDCNMLGHVEFPDSLVTIGRGAFYSCRVLSFCNLPQGLKRVSEESFASCNALPHLVVPAAVTSIGEQAFSYCSELRSIHLNVGLKTIGDSCFLRCSAVQSVAIPTTCTKISKSSFYGCDKLVLVDLPPSNGMDAIEQETFKLCISLKTIAIPYGVRRIERQAFCQCENLESVELPEQLQVIGESAFFGCKLLQNIAIPPTVIKIGRNAFQKCDHLLKIFWGDEEVLIAGLLKRFEKNPIGRIVYYFSSMMSSRCLSSTLKELDKAMLTTLKKTTNSGDGKENHRVPDVLGLTPLHMFALSQHCNLEVFIRLLSFDSAALTTQDEFQGDFPLVHACRTNAPTEIIKLLLEAQEATALTTVDLEALIAIATNASGPNSCETLQYLVSHDISNRTDQLCYTAWQERVQSTVYQIPDIATSLERKRQIELVRSTLERCEHKQSLCFLEEALWKMEMQTYYWNESGVKGSEEDEETDRWSCRINCCDEIVISNVLPFLGW